MARLAGRLPNLVAIAIAIAVAVAVARQAHARISDQGGVSGPTLDRREPPHTAIPTGVAAAVADPPVHEWRFALSRHRDPE